MTSKANYVWVRKAGRNVRRGCKQCMHRGTCHSDTERSPIFTQPSGSGDRHQSLRMLRKLRQRQGFNQSLRMLRKLRQTQGFNQSLRMLRKLRKWKRFNQSARMCARLRVCWCACVCVPGVGGGGFLFQPHGAATRHFVLQRSFPFNFKMDARSLSREA